MCKNMGMAFASQHAKLLGDVCDDDILNRIINLEEVIIYIFYETCEMKEHIIFKYNILLYIVCYKIIKYI
jgi:hypothetical protein